MSASAPHSDPISGALAPLMVWAAPASNTGPRGFTREVLEMGPVNWAGWLGTKLRGRGVTEVCIAYPGGQEIGPEGKKDLRLDMLRRAAAHPDPLVQACGDYQLWADAAMEFKTKMGGELGAGVQVGMYLGTTDGMTRQEVIETCFTINNQWSGFVDYIVIDTLASRSIEHLDWLAAHLISAGKIRVKGEARPVRGKPLLATEYLCYWDKWLMHNASEGDEEHLSRAEFEANGARIVILDADGELNAETVGLMRARGQGVCVGVDRIEGVAMAS